MRLIKLLFFILLSWSSFGQIPVISVVSQRQTPESTPTNPCEDLTFGSTEVLWGNTEFTFQCMTPSNIDSVSIEEILPVSTKTPTMVFGNTDADITLTGKAWYHGSQVDATFGWTLTNIETASEQDFSGSIITETLSEGTYHVEVTATNTNAKPKSRMAPCRPWITPMDRGRVRNCGISATSRNILEYPSPSWPNRRRRGCIRARPTKRTWE